MTRSLALVATCLTAALLISAPAAARRSRTQTATSDIVSVERGTTKLRFLTPYYQNITPASQALHGFLGKVRLTNTSPGFKARALSPNLIEVTLDLTVPAMKKLLDRTENKIVLPRTSVVGESKLILPRSTTSVVGYSIYRYR